MPRPPCASLLLAIGEDPDRDGLRDTPARVARAYGEIFAGLDQEPGDVLKTTFEIGHEEPRDRARHRRVLDLRAPPGAVPRRRARRVHPGGRRSGHRPVEAWPGWSTCTPAGRRCRSG
ncbi:hypothetical protein GCM10025868_29580 [Angustibacter aerolatus]|uniref:GTP cyclohydrolase I domain-containing protein n=1 Tax=Angustibacter aerolatus TaxID=1162965 RepID=A0ABQ6JJX6_9ACTN|nr:hypothetical protein GCM10025868_29580 [Angustibacter aerolatus]